MAVENLQRDWYVVYSNPHKEEQAQFHLALKGMKSFFPKLYIPAAENRGRIWPLFPNYLFVRLHMETECHPETTRLGNGFPLLQEREGDWHDYHKGGSPRVGT